MMQRKHDARALARAAKSQRPQRVPAPDRGPSEAFKWAWEKLDNWGPLEKDGSKVRNWNYAERIERSQSLAWYAINAPLWTPTRKRWRAIEGQA